MIAPLAKTGVISATANLWLAVPIGFVFGVGLYFAGFTDSRRIARAFYLKDVGVPVVMFSAIVTGMLGLWLLSLIGFIDTSKMYYLPTYLVPMAIGGLLFGVGMAVGGFCPGTAAASIATGRIDAMIFIVGFLGGSILFGDLFPIWGDFYNSDDRGVFRLDQAFGLSVGVVVLMLTVAAIGGSLLMRAGQHYFWPGPDANPALTRAKLKVQIPLIALALVVAGGMALFPTDSFLKPAPADWFIIQKSATAPSAPGVPATDLQAHDAQAESAPASTPAPHPRKRSEGC